MVRRGLTLVTPGPARRRISAGFRRFSAAILAAGVLMTATDAVALWDDRLELFVDQTITRDENVFRISNGFDPAAVLGSSSKADTYSTTSLGFNIDVPVSRQRLQARWARNITRYDRFTVLNLDDGRDGRVTWLWQAGNELSGQLGYTDTLALASLANTQGGVQTGTPNVLTTQRAFFNAAYRLTPRWRMRGETSRLKQSNEVPALQVNDVIIDGAEFTVSYVTPAENQIGLSLGEEDGRCPNRQHVAGTLIDNAYRQHRVAVVTDWTLTGRSRINARAGWVNRNHEQLPQRDFEGATLYAAYDWRPTGKLSLVTVAQKDIVPLDDIYSRSVEVKSIALRPLLRLTEKTDLSGLLEYSKRDYLRDPVPGAVAARTDQVRAVAVTAAYRPTRTVTLLAAVRRETRASTVAFGDYETTIASVSVRVGF